MILSDFVRLTTREHNWFRELRYNGRSTDLSASLQRLHSIRESADYEIKLVSREMARLSLQFARRLVSAVEERL